MSETGRLGVRKTLKLYIDGGFERSESGRSYPVVGIDGSRVHAARASRKDVRDAVSAARRAADEWARRPAAHRGQILYRIAEIMESRRPALVADVAGADPEADADAEVEAAIDLWVHYAGWADKVAQVAGGLNPVAGPFFNISVPEAVGVVGIVAPSRSVLEGLVACVAPAICGGNAAVVVASERAPGPAIALAECVAVSDVPAGVINLLTGHLHELAPPLASHLDVDALAVSAVPDALLEEVERAAADGVTRVVGCEPRRGPDAITAFMEIKTVWHPKGR